MMAVKLESFMKLLPDICQTLLHVLFTRCIFIYLWQRRSEYHGYSISAACSVLGWVFPSPLSSLGRVHKKTKKELAVWATSGSEQDPIDPAELGSGRRRPGYLRVEDCGNPVGLGDSPAAAVVGLEVKGCSSGRVSD